MKKPLSVLVLALLSIALLVGCNPTNPLNHSPIISNATPAQTAVTVSPSEVVNFSVTASDQDNDVLTYAWTASKGTPAAGTAAAFSWTAPTELGNVTVSVVVQDGKGGTVTKSWTMTVSNENPSNHAPVITAATPTETTLTVDASEVVNFSVTASDEDDDTLTYAWTANKGTPTSGSTAAFAWTAPAEQGTATVSVAVQDGNGGNVTKTWTVTVGTETPSVIEITEDIATATTWETGKVYFIKDGYIQVKAATLTIQPGAIIKFNEGAAISVCDGAVVKAKGTATQPIIFTSIRDDQHGGDTNGDGASQGEAGDWHNIVLRNVNGHVFEYCQFLYGGSTSGDCTLNLEGVSATIDHCTFANNASEQYGALWAANAIAGTKIQNNIFYNNGIPLYISTAFSLDNSNIFHNPDDASVINTQNGIFVDNDEINSEISWSETEVPYVIENNSIDSIGSLTIANGVVVKFLTNGYIYSYGTINATGVTFTSIKDDTKGNTDADTTGVPEPADWDGINFYDNSNATFKQCQFTYAKEALYICDATVTIEGCTFAYNDGFDGAALDASGATRSSKIISNTFYENVKPLRVNSNLNIDNSNTFSYNGKTNEYNSILVTNSEIKYPVAWGETEVAYVAENVSVHENASLTFADNVVLKIMTNGYLYYTNGLNLGTNCFITAYPDDSLKGDSNNDGNATPPYAGYWEGVYSYAADDWVVSSKFLWSEYSSL